MAGSVNKAILVGRLGRDPELRYTQSNTPVCDFSIATDEQWKDQSGSKQTRTEWHRIVVWGRQAEIASRYLSKGRLVYIEGRIQTSKYTDREGVERKSTEIVARDIQFLGGRGDDGDRAGRDESYGGSQRGAPPSESGGHARGSADPAPAAKQAPGPSAPPADEFTEDDIPF